MGKSTLKKILIPVISAAAAIMIVGAFILTAFSVVVYTNIAVINKGGDIKSEITDNGYDCILVLGAGLRGDGTPSDMLADRLTVAIELYNNGVSDTILLSGDRSDDRDYDEVSAMETFCIANGVDPDDIIKDEKGYSTYESVFNLKEMGNFERIVVVTQKYHLYRALFIAEEMGYDAVGADAAIRTYRGQIMRDIREIAARTKDFFMVRISV